MTDTHSEKNAAAFIPLPRSYKDQFSFRLAAPSFVYPADYVTNVRLLAPCLDEIELLLFECEPQAPASYQSMLADVPSLTKMAPVGFNVHLPLDAALGAADASRRLRSIHGLQMAIEASRALCPSTFTLHLDFNTSDAPPTRLQWIRNLEHSLQILLAGNITGPELSIENLDYPLQWVQPLIEAYNLRVCLDLGHLLRYGHDEIATFESFADRIVIMHLHGIIDNKTDHVGLNHLRPHERALIARILNDFRNCPQGKQGVTVLEVFNYNDLKTSLEVLMEDPLFSAVRG